MHIFWYNGSLMLEPENAQEREALALLARNAKQGRRQIEPAQAAPRAA